MRAERRDIKQTIGQLTTAQWNQDSLCAGWTVRDVVAHLVAWDDLLLYRSRDEHARALIRFAALYTTSLASMNLVNRRLQRRTRDVDVETLVARFGADDGDDLKWLFDGTNPAAHLAEYVIHHLDILRPLGEHREIAADRLHAALSGVRQLPGVRIRAWVRRHQPTRHMADEDRLLFVAGRADIH